MKRSLVKRIAILAAVAVLGMTAAACGGKAAETGTAAALTEDEYVAKTQELSQAMADAVTNSAAVDPSDVEGAKKMIEELKTPFADTQAKYKTGCEAMIEYLDMCVDMMDPEKAAELDMDKLTSLLTTIQNDFTEAASLMEAAGN